MFNFLNTTDPKANRNRLVLLLVAVMILGLIGGATMNRRPADTPTTDAKTVTQTETKTPQSCLDYIEHSETAFGYAQESMSYAGDAFQAIADYDLKAAEQASQDMRSVKPKLDALTPKLMQAKADCKASK